MPDLVLGTFVPTSHTDPDCEIVSSSSEAGRSVSKSWFRKAIERDLGQPVFGQRNRLSRGDLAAIGSIIGKHILFCAQTGGGKSRTLTCLVKQLFQPEHGGFSAIIIEPKRSSVETYAALVREIGIPASRLTIVSSSQPAIPGWNPFLVPDLALTQVCSDLAAIVVAGAGSTYPRMTNLCLNLLLLVGAHRLSLIEAARALQQPEYLSWLCGQPLPPALGPNDRLAVEEAQAFFESVMGTWSKSERSSAIAPLINRLGELTRSYLLQALLCSHENTIDLASFWHEQRVLIIHIDNATLSNAEVRFLAGYVGSMVLQTAKRQSGSRNVLLVVDEAATAERFLGASLVDILTIARSMRLHLLIVCQFLDQLGDDLRKAVLSQTAIQIYLRLGSPSDAQAVASVLSVGTRQSIRRVVVGLDDRESAQRTAEHQIFDPAGQPLRMPARHWTAFCREDLIVPDTVSLLYAYAGKAGIFRLYVKDALSGEPVELQAYLRGLLPGEVDITGPAPLQAVITFPSPKVSGVERWGEADAKAAWTRTLLELPTQHGVVRMAGVPPSVVRISDVPDRGGTAEDLEFIAEAVAANGHSPADIQESIRKRRAAIAERSSLDLSQTEASDGSIF